MYRDLVMVKFRPCEILVYLRKSRSDDPSLTTEEVLEKHEKILLEWIERNLDGMIPEENWYREVVSGETIADRGEFQKLLKRIESPTIKAVLCVEAVRLSRGDLEDCGRIIKIFRYTDTLVITPNRTYDLRDEFEREGFERELKHGNYYLEYTKTVLKRGMDRAVEDYGAFVRADAPYGYRRTRVAVGKRKVATLQIHEEEARFVRLIFDWYVNEGLGAQKIANRLDEMGAKPRKTKTWCSHTVRKILENEHYIGKIKYGAYGIKYEVENLNVKKKKVKNAEYKLYDGMHEAIIDEDTFYRAKARRDSNPKIKYGLTIRNPLASILYCECGHAMTYAIHSGIGRFECPDSRHCKTGSIDATEMMDIICDVLQKNMDDISVDINGSNDDIIKKHTEHISYLKKKLKDMEKKELSLWEKYTEDAMPKNVFDNLRTKLEEDKKATEDALDNAIKNMPQRIDYEERRATLHGAIECIKNKDVSAEDTNRLMKACIERIYYKRDKIVRGKPEDVKEGQTFERGWIRSEPTITVKLRL